MKVLNDSSLNTDSGKASVLLDLNLYVPPLSQIIHFNNAAYHSYADDTEIYLALSSSDCGPLDSLSQCLE